MTPGYLPINVLGPGDRFRFHYYPTARVSDETYVYCGRGWYRDSDGKKWHTGKHTAVKRVREERNDQT